MKTLIASATLASLLFAVSAATPIYAATAPELLQKNACMACHSVDKKVLGPAFKEIAKKYKGNAEAVTMLGKKVKEGGSGVWGPVPMPAQNGKVNDADIKTMVEHILSQ